MRWLFVRGDDTLTCHLGLGDEDLTYQLTTSRPSDPSAVTSERYVHVGDAFQRQSDLEARLIRDGWLLESYSSLTVEKSEV